MFHKAARTKRNLRLALYGPSGSGKTYTSLLLARTLGKRIAVIDTEHGSANLYAGDVADFDTAELRRFAPEDYIDAMQSAAKSGFDVLIIDSLSHAWMGKGGLLDQADAKGGRFDAWKGLTPQQHQLIEAILAYPGHVLATMRSKTEYVVSKDDRGKTSVERVGLAPVQKDGTEYEFDVVGTMDQENVLHIVKSRCSAVRGDIRKPGAELAKTLLSWLDSGAAPATSSEPPKVAPAAAPTNSEPKADDDWKAIVGAIELRLEAATEPEILTTVAKEMGGHSFPKEARERLSAAYRKASERIQKAHAAAE